MSHASDERLYLLAFDHRTSFERGLFGITSRATQTQRQRMSEAKQLILEGLLLASRAVPLRSLGALVDERHGSAAARRAREAGVLLAMCAETSSAPEFSLEYGEHFDQHIAQFRPDFVKVLARYNVEGDTDLNRRQADRLAKLSHWLAKREPKLLFELIVPPEPKQLADLGHDIDRFSAEIRPALAAAAIRDLHSAGVEPDVWKVEGLESNSDCRMVVNAARAANRDNVGCIVLGAGAPERKVAHWLRQAAIVPGFIGFAIGRTIWWTAIDQWRRERLSAQDTVAQIAAKYSRAIEVFAHAADD